MAIATNGVTATNDLDLKDRLVAVNRVTKVIKGGCTFTFAAVVIVSSRDDVVGYGIGRASEVPAAITKGVEAAKKNLIHIPIHNGTIPHEQIGHLGGARILLRPASAGSGVIAGDAMRAVLDSVGVTGILAKSQDSANPHNLVKATITALTELHSPLMVVQSRGISVERVFKG